MDKVDAMIEAHGWQELEFVAWEWCARLEAEKRTNVESALASHGVDGIGDLVLAGPVLGGIDDADVGGLVRLIGERLSLTLPPRTSTASSLVRNGAVAA